MTRMPVRSTVAADLECYLAGKPVAAPHYYYRLDEREIVAARPGGVVLAAFIILLVSLCVFMFLCSVGLMMGTMFLGTMFAVGATMMGVQVALAGVILAGGIFVSRGILAAHIWARWVGVVLIALICLD